MSLFFNLRGSVFVSTSFFFCFLTSHVSFSTSRCLTCLFFNLTHLLFNLACLLFNTCNASFPSPLDWFPLCLLGLCGPCPTLFLLTPKSRGFWYSSTSCVCLVACVACHTVGVCICGQCVFFFVLGLGVQFVAADDSKDHLLLSRWLVVQWDFGLLYLLANRVPGLVLYDILSGAPVLAGVPGSYSCGRE